ncbi:tetratricopeptide repeat protein [Azospirillum sp. 11R-A]|uniref:tetratricopeptide repeat protein n=1 Tax=Azospirillum sp. 11R-A TaxID=3111634 RepID=UPI003C285A75
MMPNQGAASIDIEAWRANIRRDVEINYLFHMGEAIGRLNGDTAGAVSRLTACLALEPDHIGALDALIRTLEAAGASAEAAEWQQRAESRIPGFAAEAALFRANALAVNGDFDAAAAELDLARRLGANPHRCAEAEAELMHNRAVSAKQAGRIDEALDLFNHAMRLRPDWISPARLRAQVLKDSGRDGEALRAWQSMLEQWPEDSEVNLQVGAHLQQQGQLAEALPYLERATHGLWSNAFLITLLGLTLLGLDRPKEAVSMLRHATTLGSNGDVHGYLAQALLATKDATAAVGCLVEANRAFGPDPARSAMLGLALLTLGQRKEAAAAIDANQRHPDPHPLTVIVASLISLPDELGPVAHDRWRTIAQRYDYPMAHLVLAGLLARAGDAAAAQHEAETAAKSPWLGLARRLLPDVVGLRTYWEALLPPPPED